VIYKCYGKLLPCSGYVRIAFKRIHLYLVLRIASKRSQKNFANPFKTLDMKKITTLLNAQNEQVQETLIVASILAVIVTISVLFI
jgi:hypothetical protein